MVVRPCLHRFEDGTACLSYTHAGSYCEVHRAEHRSPSTKVASTTKHRRRRAMLIRQLEQGVFMTCMFCGRRLQPGDRLQLHHIDSVALTDADGPSVLVCARCNWSDGGRLAARLK